MLNVGKTPFKSEGGCLDLMTCRGSTTRIVFQSVKMRSRMACRKLLGCDQEALFSIKSNQPSGKEA